MRLLATTLGLAAAASVALLAQGADRPPTSPTASIQSVVSADASQPPATVRFFNRPIVDLRATVLGRSPAERASAAERRIAEIARERIVGPVETRPLDVGTMISIASKGVVVLTSADVDALNGDTLQAAATLTADRLQEALREAVAARSLAAIALAVVEALAGLGIGALVVWGLTRARLGVSHRLEKIAERTAARSGLLDLESLRSSRILELQRWLVSGVYAALCLTMAYVTVGYALRRFAYTRPWGDSMRVFLVTTAEQLSLGIANAVPGLIIVAIILVLARFVIRLIGLWFSAVERGQVRPRWIYPETAQPTKRLMTTFVWLFAIVMAYPYLPGSQTEAFKGISVFVGLMVTFGSTGLVNHIMSGFMITYSRALRLGDFVRIGEVEGTVVHLGSLSIKLKTPKAEEITIPNAVVVGQTITDYSRFGDVEGVYTPTSVTIGYDTPWRQVHALLLLAAERSSGIRRDPHPVVLQTSLEDFYVKYTLLVCLERQDTRIVTLAGLHAHVQDLFNEYGVQIMSPNYVMDPAAAKVVARKDWYAAPAAPDATPAAAGTQTVG